jgi:hypothetical protein
MLNIDVIRKAAVAVSPFPHFAAYGAIDRAGLQAVARDFPAIDKPGIFPLSELQFGDAFGALIADIESTELEDAISDRFGIDLSDLPLMVTVRGFCRERDGRIHNDSRDKVVTCLLYLNEPGWPSEGGRLRFLHDDRDLDNVICEVPPDGGNFVAFKRTENSWHGHAPYKGPRRYIMFNWLTSDSAFTRNIGRHRISAAFKRLGLSG